MRIKEGGNYAIDLDSGIATLRVWRRPDLTFDEGAQLAALILADMRELAGGTEARGFVMDLRDAPVLAGKRTRAVLCAIVGACEAADKPIGVLLNTGVQRTLLERELAPSAPSRARFFAEPSVALGWLASAVSPLAAS
jgi:hypothetical protein